MAVALGASIQEGRQRRGWTMTQLAVRARLSVGTVSGVEAGRLGSVETYARLAVALGLGLEMVLADRRRRPGREATDIVHAAMGEIEASWLQQHGFPTALAHPYQHYQFAGRADVIAWSEEPRALLHLENRTRFPDLQSAAGSYNAKRQYLARTVAEQTGLGHFDSQTHVLVGLWSAEVIHAVRSGKASFRALCPDGDDRLRAWLRGVPPPDGMSSSFVLLDPFARGRQRRTVKLADVLGGVRPRVRGYHEAAERLQQAR
jgi:transcriptional regulator with XRE-family HTH domain